MLTFTMDTNCIIAVEKREPAASSVWELVTAHREGRADVAFVAISASENRQDRSRPRSFAEFQEHLTLLTLGDIPLLRPMAYWDLTFWDWSNLTGPEQMAREREIHVAMFPQVEFGWPEFAVKEGVDVQAQTGKPYWKWVNRFCDRQVFWAHDFYKRDVMVTENLRGWRNLVGHPSFPGVRIMTTRAAAALI